MSVLLVAITVVREEPTSAETRPQFVTNVTNRFFPLQPGTTFYYKGEKEGVPSGNIVNVTDRTRRILGVTCIVVHDRAFENSTLVEDTLDFYAHDSDRNVWYFGEDSKELAPDGTVISTEGSWLAGVNGARPGIIMEAHPRVGDRYFQELAPDVAEDQAQVLSLNKEACVEYGCFDDLLLTKEWSRLSPGEVEHKYYAADVGFILGIMVKGGDERTELVRITHGTQARRD
jgi:hypothetical protein